MTAPGGAGERTPGAADGRDVHHAGDVEVVHVVAKTHCDLGFTDLAGVVCRQYLDVFFPRALAVAAELRERGGPERLVWTTGSLVLHWALTRGGIEARAATAAGVARGDLAWHALPATTHTELMDADLVRSGLALSAGLDEQFRPAGSAPTCAAKMTDVPGHTRSLVPLLVEADVSFLHLGVNPAWPVPDVPPLFRWRSPDGSEVVVAYQAGGYGGTVHVPGMSEVLTFLHAEDNIGPPSADDVIAAHAVLRERVPGAEIRASTLDAFGSAVAASPCTADLPVITAEIGDPWLFGTGSDPAKVAAYRHLLRARTAVRDRLEADGEAVGPDLVEVDQHLLLVAEHTWGLDQKTWLPDTERWDRAGLAELRDRDETRHFERSWQEQRDYVDRATRLLAAQLPLGWGSDGGDSLGGSARDPLRPIDTTPSDRTGSAATGDRGPDASAYREVEPGAVIDGGPWQLEVDPIDGSLRSLVDRSSGRVLADAGHPLGLLRYQSFDAEDYERYYAGLTPIPADEWWARWDNTKPGIDAVAAARSGTWTPDQVRCWYRTTECTGPVSGAEDPDEDAPDARGRGTGGRDHELVVQVRFPDTLSTELGAPPVAWMRWTWFEPAAEGAPVDSSVAGGGPAHGSPTITCAAGWPDKPANRLPEALWWSFSPVVAAPDRWTIDKLGQPVSPLDVVRRGGRSLHAVGDGGLHYDGPEGSLRLHSVDAPLVAPGRPNLLDADPPRPDMAGGWHILLADNCWGTNFPMWIEGPARYRVTLST